MSDGDMEIVVRADSGDRSQFTALIKFVPDAGKERFAANLSSPRDEIRLVAITINEGDARRCDYEDVPLGIVP